MCVYIFNIILGLNIRIYVCKALFEKHISPAPGESGYRVSDQGAPDGSWQHSTSARGTGDWRFHRCHLAPYPTHLSLLCHCVTGKRIKALCYVLMLFI